jgi:hypothetical protein
MLKYSDIDIGWYNIDIHAILKERHMPCNKDKFADELITWHFRVAPETVVVYRFIAPNEESEEEPVKLLEVNEETPETGRIDAFVFGPTDDAPCSTVVAMVTRNEMRKIKAGKIRLPEGWDLSRSRRYPRPRKRLVRQ